MSKLTKDNARSKRRRNRSKLTQDNLSNRPRLVVSRSLKNIQAQIVDDLNGKTLISVSSLDKSLKSEITKVNGKVERSKIVGKKIGEKAKKNKIKEVWFDRNGYPYTGRVKAMADAARKTGLKF
ncbi:MAG: 50S ribosomal protein L18 [Candidatus Neomarinimicrobiota bacterium]|nr:50S ribosomal protein L18 [Candidatus Neomarinimicrobiota bacterium]